MSKKKETPATTVVMIRNVPVGLWRKFKALCAQEGITVQQQLIDLLGYAVMNTPDNPKVKR